MGIISFAQSAAENQIWLLLISIPDEKQGGRTVRNHAGFYLFPSFCLIGAGSGGG